MSDGTIVIAVVVGLVLGILNSIRIYNKHK
jgi:type III secretory pathway component EscS